MRDSVAADLASSQSDVRVDAIRTAADSEEAWSLDVLVAALEDYDPEVRREAAHWLGRRRDPGALDALISALPDPEVSAGAAWALGELGDPAAASPLIQLLDDPDLEVRVAAARALGAVGDVSTVPLLQELAEDPATDRWSRSVAQESLEALGQEPPGGKPAGLLVWGLGLALVAAGVGAATAWGVLGVIPFAGGLTLLLWYQAGQMRRAASRGWKWRGAP